MATVQELYATAIKSRPAPERLELATLILNDLPPESMVDYSTEWSDEDLADFSRAGWNLTDRRLATDAK